MGERAAVEWPCVGAFGPNPHSSGVGPMSAWLILCVHSAHAYATVVVA
jgi:hypothetical protein